MTDDNPRSGMRERSEDTLFRQALKWFAGIASALIVAAVSWNFETLLDLQAQIDRIHARVQLVEYAMRYHGIEMPKEQK